MIWFTVQALDSTSRGPHFSVCKGSWADRPPINPWVWTLCGFTYISAHQSNSSLPPPPIHLHIGKQSGCILCASECMGMQSSTIINMLITLHFMCKNSNPSKLKEIIKNHVILGWQKVNHEPCCTPAQPPFNTGIHCCCPRFVQTPAILGTSILWPRCSSCVSEHMQLILVMTMLSFTYLQLL